MQDTVVIRRIDELGRIVIPKDMRKTLKIDIGDPMTFWVEKEDLVLRKYSPVDTFSGIVKKIAESLEEVTEKDCIVTDKERIIYASTKRKELVGALIPNDLKQAVKDKKSVVVSKTDGGEISSIFNEFNLAVENQITVPILLDGDCQGLIILFDKDKNAKFNLETVNLVRLSSLSISKQF